MKFVVLLLALLVLEAYVQGRPEDISAAEVEDINGSSTLAPVRKRREALYNAYESIRSVIDNHPILAPNFGGFNF
ncbi:hypothetical protein CHUAL_010900 [Chamberlinius hualienensis]